MTASLVVDPVAPLEISAGANPPIIRTQPTLSGRAGRRGHRERDGLPRRRRRRGRRRARTPARVCARACRAARALAVSPHPARRRPVLRRARRDTDSERPSKDGTLDALDNVLGVEPEDEAPPDPSRDADAVPPSRPPSPRRKRPRAASPTPPRTTTTTVGVRGSRPEATCTTYLSLAPPRRTSSP